MGIERVLEHGCRICMRILSGSGQTPWVWSTEGSLDYNLRSPPASPRHPTTGQRNEKQRDTDGIGTYPGMSDQITFRSSRTIASVQSGHNLRKGTSYEGENCGGLHSPLASPK